MIAPLVIARKDLRQRVRDRSAITVGLIAPVIIAALMSLAFRGADSFHFTMGVVNLDRGPVATGLVQTLQQPSLRRTVTVKLLPSDAAAATQVRDKKVAAALVIPAGFSTAATGTAESSLRALTSVNNTIAGSVTRSIASSFVAQINADRLSIATAVDAGIPASRLPDLAAQVSQLQMPEQLIQRPLGSHPVKVISYYAPAMAIFFLLFTISFTARSFFVDRAQGMIERMRAAPIRPVEILLGKALSVFVFGLASLLVIAVITSVVFGADWGSPVAAGVVCVAMVVSVVSVTALVIGLARTQRQAEGIASAAVFALALLGGNFVFVSAMPSVMRRLSLATPNGWALRAFIDLSTTGGGLSAVALPVLAILAFSAVVGSAAALLARRAVTA
ncbi:MAG TPA: ABC transporter permease [Acidimicrobiales bacterium]|nr:ABC transporter permease [Acidimicrobiales bacterium]